MISPSLSNNIGNINNPAPATKLISVGKIVCKQSSKNDPFLKINYGVVHHRTNAQYFSVNLHSFDCLTKEEKYIMKSYIKLYDYFISFKNLNTGENFYHIEKDYKFSHGIYVTETYIILATFNVFKPTNEINEVFKVKSHQNIVEFHAYIFNRWGQKLYEWTDLEGGWDGTYQGKDVKQGTYFVLVKAKGADGQTYNIRKDVNLLRGFTEGTSISQ